ncbi:hypothetical protein HDU98_009881 [Podochytrium sp. JEL0797]|nr:hypothetical protein HDU98_009881 [Podochytrium sp. JEL0797]
MSEHQTIELTDTKAQSVEQQPHEITDEEIRAETHKHTLTNDKVMIRTAIVVFVLLCLSWSSQWAAFIMPYWRGDQYHIGGLFQICGNRDFTYNATTSRIYPTIKTEWNCKSFEEYVDKFQTLFPDHNSDWYVQAGSAKKLIVVSRWFEAITTAMDMVFGVTTIWAVVYPHMDPKKQRTNMIFAIIGICLTPSFAVIDSFIQNSYWASIGVGIYNTDIQTFLYASGDISWIASAVDFALQLGFLIWGIRRQYVKHLNGDTTIAII